jgi:DNA repair photolyase
MTTPDLFPDTKIRTVISASRRTDMVAGDPDKLTALLQEKAPPNQTHSVVLWTKNPANILNHSTLFSQLEKYDQLYLQLTVTGLGDTILEPRVPPPDTVLAFLPQLVDFLKSPARINLRFDPIVHFKLKDETSVCNLAFFENLAPILEKYKIRTVTTSWVQIYGKVQKRLDRLGISVEEFSIQQESEWLFRIAKKHTLTLHGCCVPGWPQSKCINGELLNELHPRGYRASTARAAGQRPLCGCTKSVDIGWYTTCVHGCLYCYGNPKYYDVEPD